MENIKKVLRHFAQFYGQECWYNGRDGIKELPSGEEFIDIYTKELMDIFNKPVIMNNKRDLNQQKSIQHLIDNEIGDTGKVSITTAINAVKIAYREIIDMIESNFETISDLGEGETEARRIQNEIEEIIKKRNEYDLKYK